MKQKATPHTTLWINLKCLQVISGLTLWPTIWDRRSLISFGTLLSPRPAFTVLTLKPRYCMPARFVYRMWCVGEGGIQTNSTFVDIMLSGVISHTSYTGQCDNIEG